MVDDKMTYWDEYLKNPPFEVSALKGIRLWENEDDAHCVLWRGYEGFDHEELWDFGSGNRWKGRMPAPAGFPTYGGETLCGLDIESGEGMYGPRWKLRTEHFGQERYTEDDYVNSDGARAVLMDMHGITCMTCRRKLMYGICRLIHMLSSLRDAVGTDYVENAPLVPGKRVLSSKTNSDGTHSESYQHLCSDEWRNINPVLVDYEKEPDKITCPVCKGAIEVESSSR